MDIICIGLISIALVFVCVITGYIFVHLIDKTNIGFGILAFGLLLLLIGYFLP